MMEAASCRWTADRPGRIAHATLLICVQALGFFVIGPALLAPSILGDADPFQGAPAAIGLFATLSVVDVIGLIGYGLLRVGRIGLQSVFVEETLLRGYLQPAFIARWGTVAGILMTAAGFALYQLNPRPYALAAKFAFGIILGVLKGRDRSLFAPAVAHALLWNIVGTT